MTELEWCSDCGENTYFNVFYEKIRVPWHPEDRWKILKTSVCTKCGNRKEFERPV